MKSLYIRNKSDTGDTELNQKNFRAIYYSQEGEVWFYKLQDFRIATPRDNKVIPLKRKIDLY